MKIPDPKASTLVKFNFIMMIVWVLLGIPTVLWWNQSILWVGAMSVYAIVVGHFSAFDAARAEQAQEKNSQEG